MENNSQLSDIEEFQKREDDRLEYQGYCNTICKGLEEIKDNSGERAIWELIQNARDMQIDGAKIKIELTDQQFTFSHHGKPFEYATFKALVKQDSSKDRLDADLVGQYGTGFMTTHAFNRLVYVNGPFVVKKEADITVGYVQVKDFKLDRTRVDQKEGPFIMKEQLDQVKSFCREHIYDTIQDDTTSFRYELSSVQVEEVSKQLSSALRLMPFVLVINEKIKEIEIYDHYKDIHYTLKRGSIIQKSDLTQNGWHEIKECVNIINHHNKDTSESVVCMSLQSDKGDIVIIPPYPISCGSIKDIPSLFMWFPLLGTESFGVNFIFHSRRFHPVEKRNNIMLPGSGMTQQQKGGENSSILKEMTDVLFAYYEDENHTKSLSRELCEVAFPLLHEDEETRAFYSEMQNMWKAQIYKWKILPIGDKYYSISDNHVKLLHPNLYRQLDAEQKIEYENILAKYALYPQIDGNSYLMPTSDLIKWSETVDRWQCDKDEDFFLSVEDICKSINNQTDDLHKFLKLMNDSGNSSVMDSYPLVPNRKGELKKKGELYYGSFMTKEVYELVHVLMGDNAKKMIDPAFLDICTVNTYKPADLQNAISSTISSWKESTLGDKEKTSLNESQLHALLTFCAASCSVETNNSRNRMMPLIFQFYEKTFSPITTIRFRESEEEEFYKSAFNFLLDYTLYQISLKNAQWVEQHNVWLYEFIKEYSPSTNETHLKRLNEYGILPNQYYGLCIYTDLHKNAGVPEEMTAIYKAIFNKDLKENWIHKDFESLVSPDEDKPEDVASKIEGALIPDMDLKKDDRKFTAATKEIILYLGDPLKKDQWKNWFKVIDNQKAAYTFSLQSGDGQKSLFALMDLDDDSLVRLAKLSKNGDMVSMIDKMEHLQELERYKQARFDHLHKIGKRIEDELRKEIESQLVDIKYPKMDNEEATAEDIQGGQDIVICIKTDDGWKDIFYIEVKSKWDFSESAHMSTRQIQKAVRHADKYALCCVYLKEFRNEDLCTIPKDTIIQHTKVKMNIGYDLSPMMAGILETDEKSSDEQIKISGYHSDMSEAIFIQGEPFHVLLDKINRIVELNLKK